MDPKPPTLEDWIERDLTAAAVAGQLNPAFGVEERLAQLAELIDDEPSRSPVISGPSGVGKSALISELVRRVVAGQGPRRLRGARVVQVSLEALAGRFKDPSEATGPFQDLLDEALEADPPLVLVIRDLSAAYRLDWESVLYRFLSRHDLPIIGESHPRRLNLLLNGWNDLGEYLVPVVLTEPPLPRLRELIAAWSKHHGDAAGLEVTADAQRVAIALSARFGGVQLFPRKAIDLLRQTLRVAQLEGHVAIDRRAVVGRFSDLSRVPRSLLDPDERLDLDAVHDFLCGRLLGQPEAADAVERMLALMKAGLSDLRRPFGVFLFVGPTGVGKTHTAQLLAEYLFGDRGSLMRLNMADYSTPAHVGRLFGDPNSPSISLKRGALSELLAGRPFGVLLLDELEKADKAVHDALLELVDEGRFTNGAGEVVPATSFIMVATSNAGAEIYRETGVGFRDAMDAAELTRELDKRLLQVFRFEFLNRFDRVVHFQPLDRAHIRAIAERELAELGSREGIVDRGLLVDVDVEVVDWLVAHGYHPHFGARFLRREIERHATSALADAVVRHHPEPGSRLRLRVRRGRIAVQVEAAAAQVATIAVEAGEAPKVLDHGALLTEAREWLARWQRLQEEHERRKADAGALLVTSQEPDFWSDTATAQDVLRRYKALDARLAADRRLLGPIKQLRQAVESEAPLGRLAPLVETAADGFRRWLELGADEAPDGAWLVLGPADGVSDVDATFLGELIGMYRGWTRRHGLHAEVVAEQPKQGGGVDRVVLEVDGPGAHELLGMEQGEHRRRRRDGRTARLGVDLLPRGSHESAEERVDDAKHVAGVFVDQRQARLRIDVPRRGLSLTFLGGDRQTMELLAPDLRAALAAPPTDRELARTYGLVGGGVRDPRTSAVQANLKAALRGDLEPFLKAWRRSITAPAEG